MKPSSQNTLYLVLIFFYFITSIFLIYYYSQETFEDTLNSERSLEKDGFVIFYDSTKYNSHQVDDRPNNDLVKDTLNQLPEGYMFMDYIYKIKNSTLFTFHRDVTSSQQQYNTKYPVYTLIVYKTEGCLISVCPGSHATYPFVWSRIVNLRGKQGTSFLFNCDLLHAGCIYGCPQPREIIQYKICHRDDVPLLQELQGVRKEKTGNSESTLYHHLLRKGSYFLSFPINYLFSPFLLRKYEKGSVMQTIQSMVPISFYNNA